MFCECLQYVNLSSAAPSGSHGVGGMVILLSREPGINRVNELSRANRPSVYPFKRPIVHNDNIQNIVVFN